MPDHLLQKNKVLVPYAWTAGQLPHNSWFKLASSHVDDATALLLLAADHKCITPKTKGFPFSVPQTIAGVGRSPWAYAAMDKKLGIWSVVVLRSGFAAVWESYVDFKNEDVLLAEDQ